jgi:hypothetical protein
MIPAKHPRVLLFLAFSGGSIIINERELVAETAKNNIPAVEGGFLKKTCLFSACECRYA